MKIKLVIMVLAISLFTGCTAEGANPQRAEKTRYNRLEGNYYPDNDNSNLRIINSNTKVGYEEYASISIIGKPGVTYSIASSYKWGKNQVEAFEKRRAGSDGMATWIWKVNSNTVPGTYPIVITGGGQRLETSYTVTP